MGKNKPTNTRFARAEQAVQQKPQQESPAMTTENPQDPQAGGEAPVQEATQTEQTSNVETSAPGVVDQGVSDEARQAAENITQQTTGVIEKIQDQLATPAVESTQAAVAAETSQVRAETLPKVVSIEKAAQAAKVTNTQEAGPSDFEAWVAQVKAEGTKAQKTLIGNIEIYMRAMQPGMTITGEAGAKQQFQFWNVIRNVVETSPEEEFRRLWTTLLRFFHQFRDGVFHDRYIFRFAEYWTQDPVQLSSYQQVLNMIKLTADPANRAKGLKQVSLDRTLEGSFNPQGKQRIMTFYMS